jgi:hypothetical protein
MKRIVGIMRAEVYSPNSVDRDNAIFNAVKGRLENLNFHVAACHEGDNYPDSDCYFSMGRKRMTLKFLKRCEKSGSVVINSAYGVEACTRESLNETMKTNNIPVAGDKGANGYWLKRGDASSQSSDDIVYAADRVELEEAKKRFKERGITSMVVSAHVKGDLVKFYGVRGVDFFSFFYPGDDGMYKFNDEERNGNPHHYVFDGHYLQREAERLSELVDTPVYGGDCIVCPDGKFKIIDFNDWPSFSRCRDDAAEAIAHLIKNRYEY